MQIEIETIAGDTPNVEWRIPVLRFAGRRPDAAPHAYLQAALHGDELPGVAVAHVLAEKLRAAEIRGDILGDVTLIPHANPIGAAQSLFADNQGRYDVATRVNFNRAHPVLTAPDAAALLDDAAPVPADVRLKHRLVRRALSAEIVLDLHCDEEALPYIYFHAALWPAARDLAAALATEVVLLWDGDGGAAFEEAALAPHMPNHAGRVVATVEFRGNRDVERHLAEADAEGLMRFLAGRGVVEGTPPAPHWDGVVAPLEHVEMLRAPVGGAVIYDVPLGAHVEAGARIASILARPGEPGGAFDVHTPQAGIVLSRRDRRMLRRGDDLAKIVGTRDSTGFRPGPLED